jgi:hypothetical protein
LALLSGCVSTEPSSPITQAERIGTRLVLTLPDAHGLLDSVSGRWRIVGGVFERMTIDYRVLGPEWPQRWILASETGASVVVKLDVSAANPHVNDSRVSTAGFTVTPPAGAAVLTLDELRARGLRGKR